MASATPSSSFVPVVSAATAFTASKERPTPGGLVRSGVMIGHSQYKDALTFWQNMLGVGAAVQVARGG